MNKIKNKLNSRVILSGTMIVAAVAIVAGAAFAFFSDTETSTGNVLAAGAIDLQIDNTSYVTNAEGVLEASPETSWQLADLTIQKFFNFTDLKPGDIGEDTISIHVNNNDAYVCAAARVTEDVDNTFTEPELEDDLTTDGDPSETPGELGDNLNFAFWNDDGDNVYEVGEEIFLQGPLSGIGEAGQIALADTTTNIWEDGEPGPVLGGVTHYIGKAWCFGELLSNNTPQDGVNTGNPITNGTGFTCNGAPQANNAAQTDRVTGDIQFYAIQSRNNAQFTCAGNYTPEWPENELVIADSYETGFEPGESFSVGDINGQNGWKKTGPYDAAIVSSPVIADDQSLRISNSVTSGSFGDQTFAPELSSGAGETGVGTENHYEAEFEIKTTEPTEQAGLFLSVSPDDGLGSRMSYLSFADEAGGVRVTFYDVTNAGPISTVSTFNSTDLGLLDRSTVHTIKFVMDFVDGTGNDVVKIYIDNVLVHTGTSWEDYYRYDPEQAGNGNVLFAVDSLIFRVSGTAAPANAGKGYLIDKVSLLTGTN